MTDKDKIRKYLLDEWNIKPNTLLESKIREIINEQIDSETKTVKLLQAMVEICPHCYDAERGCQCSNDE